MKIEALELEGAYSIQPKLIQDARGFFLEWLNLDKFNQATGQNFQISQLNNSRSSKGVLRGLHYQLNPCAQSKLVGATAGVIQDVIVDIRQGSKTYGKSASFILDAEKKNQLFVPQGFAHGFLVLSEMAEIFYAVDNPYSPEHDCGINYSDPSLQITWELDSDKIQVSDKDRSLKNLIDAQNNFEI